MSDRKSFRWLDPDQEDADAVLRRLLQEAADAIPGLSSDPSLTDPLVRLILGAVSREYARLYGKLDSVIDDTYRRMISHLLAFPRAPRPSSTVLQLSVKDALTNVDENLQVVGSKAIGGSDVADEQSVHFSPPTDLVVPGIPSPVVLFEEASGVVHQLADGTEAPGEPGNLGPQWSSDDPGSVRLHLGVDLPEDLDLDGVPVFLACDHDMLGKLSWARWVADPDGSALSFRPGEERRLEGWHDRSEPPMFQSRTDQVPPRSPYERNFVTLSADFLRAARGINPGAVLAGIHSGQLPSVPGRSWISIMLDGNLGTEAVRGLRVLTNCVPAFNLNRSTLTLDLGSEPVRTADLDLSFAQLFKIYEVYDADHRVYYQDAERADGLRAEHRYHLDESPAGLVRLRLSSRNATSRPRRIEVSFATTHGHDADGLDAGSIDVIYDRQYAPGVEAAVNVVKSAGGGAARHETDNPGELRALLASRGRALTSHDYRALVNGYNGPLVNDVQVGRGILETATGLQNAVHVTVTVDRDQFSNELEASAYQHGLQEFLQLRAPAGQAVTVGLAR